MLQPCNPMRRFQISCKVVRHGKRVVLPWETGLDLAFRFCVQTDFFAIIDNPWPWLEADVTEFYEFILHHG